MYQYEASLVRIDRRSHGRTPKQRACSLADPNVAASVSFRLNAWTERKERGWEGDVPPIHGLSLREETDQLFAQVSRRAL